MQRDIGPVEHAEQFGLVGVQPREQAIEGDEAGPATKDAIEARAQFAARRPVGSVDRLQVAIEPPDQPSQVLLRLRC